MFHIRDGAARGAIIATLRGSLIDSPKPELDEKNLPFVRQRITNKVLASSGHNQ
jgi:hypothetical protein